MLLRPIEPLENRRPKCKMHTQQRQLTRFFVFYNWSTKKTEPTVFKTEPKPNRTRGFAQNQTELQKSIPNIPSGKLSTLILTVYSMT